MNRKRIQLSCCFVLWTWDDNCTALKALDELSFRQMMSKLRKSKNAISKNPRLERRKSVGSQAVAEKSKKDEDECISAVFRAMDKDTSGFVRSIRVVTKCLQVECALSRLFLRNSLRFSKLRHSLD